MAQVNVNCEYWKSFDDSIFDYQDPLASAPLLQLAFRDFLTAARTGSFQQGKAVRSHSSTYAKDQLACCVRRDSSREACEQPPAFTSRYKSMPSSKHSFAG